MARNIIKVSTFCICEEKEASALCFVALCVYVHRVSHVVCEVPVRSAKHYLYFPWAKLKLETAVSARLKFQARHAPYFLFSEYFATPISNLNLVANNNEQAIPPD